MRCIFWSWLFIFIVLIGFIFLMETETADCLEERLGSVVRDIVNGVRWLSSLPDEIFILYRGVGELVVLGEEMNYVADAVQDELDVPVHVCDEVFYKPGEGKYSVQFDSALNGFRSR